MTNRILILVDLDLLETLRVTGKFSILTEALDQNGEPAVIVNDITLAGIRARIKATKGLLRL